MLLNLKLHNYSKEKNIRQFITEVTPIEKMILLQMLIML